MSDGRNVDSVDSPAEGASVEGTADFVSWQPSLAASMEVIYDCERDENICLEQLPREHLLLEWHYK